MQPSFDLMNAYFDKIYVLTLHRATERQAQINTLLKGLNFQFFLGVDNKTFEKNTLIEAGIYSEEKAIQLQRYNKPMTPGQIGCSWSHVKIYEDMMMNQYKKVLILEDDVFPITDTLPLFEKMVASLPPNWELLYFDYDKNTTYGLTDRFKQFVYQVQSSLGFLKWSKSTIQHLYAQPYSPFLKKAGYHMYTSAYAITNKAAQTLLKEQTPIAHVADHLLAHCITNQKITGFISIPKLFGQLSQGNIKQANSYVD